MLHLIWHWFSGGQDQACRNSTGKTYGCPLPVEVFALPAFVPSNPLSYVRLALIYSATAIASLAPHRALLRGYYSPATGSVHVTDDAAIQTLWRMGFFGKGSLSRSEPEWIECKHYRGRFAQSNGDGGTAGEITNRRRQERREGKRLRAQRERKELEEQLRIEGKLDHQGLDRALHNEYRKMAPPDSNAQRPHTELRMRHTGNQEHLQLTLDEALFLDYGLGCLEIFDSPMESAARLRTRELYELFRYTSRSCSGLNGVAAPLSEDVFMMQYAAYHHYRSLGWVVRPGIKFAVDFLLYARGPVFSHAEFAVVVLPGHARDSPCRGAQIVEGAPPTWHERGDWWFVHAMSRVQNQVLKTLLIAFVEMPSASCIAEQGLPRVLQRCSVREFVIRRWTPNRNRG